MSTIERGIGLKANRFPEKYTNFRTFVFKPAFKMAVLVRFLFYDTMSAQVFCANRKNMEKIFRVADQQFKCKHSLSVKCFLQPHNKNAIKICRHMSIQRNVDKGPNLYHFIEKHVKETLKSFDNNHDLTKTKNDTISASISNIPYVSPEDLFGNGKKGE